MSRPFFGPAAHCQAAGTVLQSEIARQASGRSKGWGLVDFASPQFAQNVRGYCQPSFTPSLVAHRVVQAVSDASCMLYPWHAEHSTQLHFGAPPVIGHVDLIPTQCPYSAGHLDAPQH